MSTSTRQWRRPSAALALCIAAGTAAGIGLARPSPVTTVNADVTVGEHVEHSQQQQASGYGAQTPQAAPSTTDSPVITISEFSFEGSLRAGAGQTVTVDNVDGVPHSLTADNGSFDTGIFDAGAASTFVAPTTPGSYEFSCLVHPTMRGTLIVEA